MNITEVEYDTLYNQKFRPISNGSATKEKTLRLKKRYSIKQVANKLGVGKSTLLRYISEYEKAR